MFTPFVSDEHPVALYAGVPPQYTSEGLAIDCALVLHVSKAVLTVIRFSLLLRMISTALLSSTSRRLRRNNSLFV